MRKTSNKHLDFTPKATRKRKTKNTKVSRRKEIVKLRAAINKNEMKETIANINKTKSWFFQKTNKIDKLLARLKKKIKKKTKKTQISKIRDEKEKLQKQWGNTKDHKRL